VAGGIGVASEGLFRKITILLMKRKEMLQITERIHFYSRNGNIIREKYQARAAFYDSCHSSEGDRGPESN
jgi:hypothetical protein